jgi:nicotinate-nucleotide adenylyltransferase
VTRLGVYGGTFDPVHIGHLVVANDVRHQLGLDRVLLVVANEPWQKADRVVASAEDRFDLVAAAVGDVPGLEPSRLEIDRGGQSYTVDTLEQLHGADPDAELHLVVGADVTDELHTWKRPDDIRRLATLVVVNRGGTASPTLPEGWRVKTVGIPDLEVSSSEVRRRLASGAPIDFLVHPDVVRLIRERALYPVPG